MKTKIRVAKDLDAIIRRNVASELVGKEPGTHKQIAAHLQITRVHWSNILSPNHPSRFTLDKLALIASFLDVEPVKLLDEPKAKKQGATV